MPRVGGKLLMGKATGTIAAGCLALALTPMAVLAEMGGADTAQMSAGAAKAASRAAQKSRAGGESIRVYSAGGFRTGDTGTGTGTGTGSVAGAGSPKPERARMSGLAASKEPAKRTSTGEQEIGGRGGLQSNLLPKAKKARKVVPGKRSQRSEKVLAKSRSKRAAAKTGDLGMGLISAKLARKVRQDATAAELKPAPDQFAAGTSGTPTSGGALRTKFDLSQVEQFAQSGSGSGGSASGTEKKSSSGQTLSGGVPGVSVDRKTPVLLTADKMSYDRNTGVVSASGNVEISQGRRVLKADTVSYNQKTGVVTAVGNVSITEPSGEVFFADRAVLTKEMREGVIEKIRILLQDDARVAANGAVRIGGNTTVMRKAVFSPCALCPDDPTKAPLWQVRADRVVHDQTKRNIEYHSGTLEFFGIPVAHIPYFYHPDPTVKRRTGLLPPLLGSDSKLGRTAQIPVYINIAPDWDATVAPIFLTKDVPVLAGEVRHRFKGGEINFQGSYTRPKRIDDFGDTRPQRVNRGHINSYGRLDIDNIWRAGYDTSLASDRTYLRRYNIQPGNIFSRATAFGFEEVLVTRGYLEGFSGRNYAAAEAFYFQNQRSGVEQSEIPFVAPEINLSYISEPLKNGSRWSVDLNLLDLHRIQGTDSRRASGVFGWEMPYIGRFGDIYRVKARLQTDLYWVNEVTQNNSQANFTGLKGRIFPQVAFDWRLPLVREYGNVRHIVEPRAAVIFGPNGANTSSIPNEDSLDFEFDDTNLFNLNRFPGLDRVDSGRRIVYGLKNSFYGNAGGRSEIFIGQSIRSRDDDTFRIGSGVEKEVSDIVGRISVNPADYFDVSYRFRYDLDAGTARRHEVFASGGPENLRFNATYLFAAAEVGARGFGVREEVSGGVSYKFHRYWTVSGSTIYDLAESEARVHAGNLKYEDECFIFDLRVSRSFTSGSDFGSSLDVGLQITFKTLGNVRASR